MPSPVIAVHAPAVRYAVFGLRLLPLQLESGVSAPCAYECEVISCAICEAGLTSCFGTAVW